MKTIKLSPLFFVAIILTANVQCTKEEFCQNKALCDLFSNTILPVAGVLLGVDLTIVSAVYNVAASNVDCTETASASSSNFDVEYRVDASSPWEIVPSASNQVLNVDPLAADGDPDENEVTMVFNQAGQYRFKTAADFDLKIDERDDDNNGSCAGCRLSYAIYGNISHSEILEVFNNPDQPFDASKPQVEIVKITKR